MPKKCFRRALQGRNVPGNQGRPRRRRRFAGPESGIYDWTHETGFGRMSPSFAEILVILLVALLVFGPRKLPHLGRQLGRAMSELRRASNEFKWQLEEEMRQIEESERAAGRKPAPGAEPTIAPPEGAVSTEAGGGKSKRADA
jgi:TatA/E family protein of Tat protein translocase